MKIYETSTCSLITVPGAPLPLWWKKSRGKNWAINFLKDFWNPGPHIHGEYFNSTYNVISFLH
jgi:hypothetical protein